MDSEALQALFEEYPGLLKADGFDDALLGVVERFNMPWVFLYDYDKMIDIMVSGGMTYQDAAECFEFNIIGAWVGDSTPCFACLGSK